MKQAKDLSCDEIINLVQSIQRYLYLDIDEQGRESWNPDKSWSGDEFDFIAQVLSKHGLVPMKPELAEHEKSPKRYVLFDLAVNELVGNRVFDDPGLAADDASELDTVIVVPVTLPARTVAGSIEQSEPCDCQRPGDFCAGVPGILARVENCRLVPGGKVERCDQCERYASDQAALDKLAELGMA